MICTAELLAKLKLIVFNVIVLLNCAASHVEASEFHNIALTIR